MDSMIFPFVHDLFSVSTTHPAVAAHVIPVLWVWAGPLICMLRVPKPLKFDLPDSPS